MISGAALGTIGATIGANFLASSLLDAFYDGKISEAKMNLAQERIANTNEAQQKFYQMLKDREEDEKMYERYIAPQQAQSTMLAQGLMQSALGQGSDNNYQQVGQALGQVGPPPDPTPNQGTQQAPGIQSLQSLLGQ